MKFSKLILMGTCLFMTGSLMAQEKEKDCSHTTYVGYEFGNRGLEMPIISHRFQKNYYILDINVGYNYVPTSYFPFHLGKLGGNAYKIITITEKGQTYTGIGLDFIAIKMHSQKMEYLIHPSVSLGYDFSIDKSAKIFVEIFYKPYEFGKYRNKSIHLIRCRMGVGF